MMIYSMPYLTSELEVQPYLAQHLQNVEKMPSPRILKSHLPFYLLHPKLLDTSKVFFFLMILLPYRSIVMKT